MAQGPQPTVDVPTREEFDDLAAQVTANSNAIAALEVRVAALEGGSTTPVPPDPVVPPDTAEGMQAQRIADTIGIFGVNTFSSLDQNNVWGSWPADYRPETVIAALDYMTKGTGHIFRIREYHYAGRETFQRPWLEMIQLAIPGTQAAMCVGANGTPSDVPSMLTMADLLAWTEGLNEPNTDFGSGQVPVEQTMDIQHRLWNEASDRLVVMGPSVVAGMPHPEGWISGYFGDRMAEVNTVMERGNGHYYPPHCSDLLGDGTALTDYVGGLYGVYGNHLIDLTEYHPSLYNSEGNKPDQPGWNGDRDAYYTLLALLRSANCGVQGLWWYALFDYGQTYICGLYPTNAANPRPAAEALRRLCHACPDLGGDARSFQAGRLDVQLSLPANCYAHLSQASDRRFFLFLWHSQNEPGGASAEVTVVLPVVMAVREVDLLSGAETDHGQTDAVTLGLPATVRVLVLG
jgi:hypothetical protein